MDTLRFRLHTSALPGELVILWSLRTIVLLSGIYQLAWGSKMLRFITLLSLVSIVYPAFLTKKAIARFPNEVEFVFLFIALATVVLGEAQNFYNKIPYYDKFVHSFIPFFMGFLGFIILYALRLVGRIQLSSRFMVGMVILMMLGLQAVWEIMEYATDVTHFYVLAWEQAQGNSIEDPYHDTMNDLVVDTIGTTLGCFVAFIALKNGEHTAHFRVQKILSVFKKAFGKK